MQLNLVHTGKKEYFHKFIIKYKVCAKRVANIKVTACVRYWRECHWLAGEAARTHPQSYKVKKGCVHHGYIRTRPANRSARSRPCAHFASKHTTWKFMSWENLIFTCSTSHVGVRGSARGLECGIRPSRSESEGNPFALQMYSWNQKANKIASTIVKSTNAFWWNKLTKTLNYLCAYYLRLVFFRTENQR